MSRSHSCSSPTGYPVLPPPGLAQIFLMMGKEVTLPVEVMYGHTHGPYHLPSGVIGVDVPPYALPGSHTQTPELQDGAMGGGEAAL